MLSCDFLDFEARAAIGRFVTEEALYDLWFVENVRHVGWVEPESELLREVPMQQTRVVYEAWRTLEAVDDLVAPNEVLRERRLAAIAGLTVALNEAAEEFVRIRAGQ
jgi:hypothetical protein